MVGYYIIAILIQGLCLSLTLFLLWNFNYYLRCKPPGHQTLLDFAYIQLFEYLGLMNTIFTIIGFSYYVFDGQIHPILAGIIAWSLLFLQQLFYYQLLICAIIRLSIVLNYNLASLSQWKSEQLFFKTIRFSVIILAFLVTLIAAGYLNFIHPFTIVLQGQTKLQSKIRVGPFLASISLLVQFTTRIIVRLRVGPSQGPSNELVNTYTFLFIFLYLLACHLAINLLKIVDFQISMTFGHGGFLVMALQILYHSKALKHFFQRKYPLIKRMCQVFDIVETSSSLSTITAVNSVRPI